MKYTLKSTLLFIITTFLMGQAIAQNKDIETDEQLWLGYFGNYRFGNKIGIWFDAHYRTRNSFVKDNRMFILRPGFTYFIKEKIRLTLGYSYNHYFPGENHQHIYRPEHRPWQQLQIIMPYENVRLMQWLRLEQRFRRKIKDADEWAAGYNFNYRIRHNVMLSIPLNHKTMQDKTWFALLNNEVFINLGKEIVYNIFDQNRAFAGFGYQLNKYFNFHVGYMNIFQQKASGNQFELLHTIRLFAFHNIHFHKKKEHTH